MNAPQEPRPWGNRKRDRGRVSDWRGVRVRTIGHSTRSIEEFVALLRGAGVSVLTDIRTIPRSAHNPQFNAEVLGDSMRAAGIRYVHLPLLGGLRRARPDSPNSGWHNASFRGFADYMLTDDFEAGLAELRVLAEDPLAVMCAEAVPWRCHRSLVADALTVRGALVEHIMGGGRLQPHRLTPFACVRGGQLTYPDGGPGGGALATAGPFHLEATVRVLQRRPTNVVDVWVADRYRRVLATPAGPVLAEVVNHGSIDAPNLRFRVLGGDSTAEAAGVVEPILRRVLGLDVDPRRLGRTLGARARWRGLATALRGLRPPRFAGLFEAVANVIPFQQVSLDAGVAVVRRLVERFGDRMSHDAVRIWGFPREEEIASARVSTLRACGLSGRKAEALRRAARTIASGELSEAQLSSLASGEAAHALDELPGIGPWSAALILLRGLGRLDVFPPGDVGAERGLRDVLGLPTARAAARAIEQAGSYRGYLYFCALAGAFVDLGLIHGAPPQDDRPRGGRPEPSHCATAATNRTRRSGGP